MASEDIALVKVNGVALPFTSDYSGSLSDLDLESGRGVNDGVMVRNRKRSNLYKLEFKYDLMTYDIASKIIQAIKPESFSVEFFSIEEGKRITRKMYVGDKSYNWVMAIPKGKTDFELCVQNLSFNLIEN